MFQAEADGQITSRERAAFSTLYAVGFFVLPSSGVPELAGLEAQDVRGVSDETLDHYNDLVPALNARIRMMAAEGAAETEDDSVELWESAWADLGLNEDDRLAVQEVLEAVQSQE